MARRKKKLLSDRILFPELAAEREVAEEEGAGEGGAGEEGAEGSQERKTAAGTHAAWT